MESKRSAFPAPGVARSWNLSIKRQSRGTFHTRDDLPRMTETSKEEWEKRHDGIDWSDHESRVQCIGSRGGKQIYKYQAPQGPFCQVCGSANVEKVDLENSDGSTDNHYVCMDCECAWFAGNTQ